MRVLKADPQKQAGSSSSTAGTSTFLSKFGGVAFASR